MTNLYFPKLDLLGLDLLGKEFVYNHHLSVQYYEPKPDLAKSLLGG